MTRAQACVVMQRIMDAQSDNPSGETTRPEETETPDVDYKLTIALMNSNLSVGDKVMADMNTIPSTAKDGLTFTFKSSDTSVATVKAYSGNSFPAKSPQWVLVLRSSQPPILMVCPQLELSR